MAVLQLLSVFTAKHSRGESPNSNQSLSLCVSGMCGVYVHAEMFKHTKTLYSELHTHGLSL